MSLEVYGIDIGAVYMVLTRGMLKGSDYIGDVLRTSTDVRVIQVFENIKFLFGQTAQKSCIRDYRSTIQLVKDSFKCSEKKEIKKPEQFNVMKMFNRIDKEYYAVYHNKLLTYTPEDFYTSLFKEAKSIMKERHPNPSEIKYESNTYVLSYPPYYTPEQISSLKTVAQRTFHRDDERMKSYDDEERIPDYNQNVHVIPEYVAAALTYGYENNSSFNEKKDIVIIDVGYNCSYCVYCTYERGSCTINRIKYTFDVSGSIVDERMNNYFTDEIKKEDDCKEKLTPKDILKLRIELSKVKEKLSASGADTVQVNVDGIMEDDEDYTAEFSVEKLNKIIKDMPSKLIKLMKDTVEKDDLNYDVVIIGGTLRIPLFQSELEKEIKHVLIRTLNMDESVSYGCIYYGAMVKGRWNYRITCNDDINYKTDIHSLLSGRWKSINHKMKVVYDQEKESNEAAKIRNSIEKKIYELQHKIKVPNKGYEGFCERLLVLLKHRGFVYIPPKMLKLYEDEIDRISQYFDMNTDFKIVESTYITQQENKQKNGLKGLLNLDSDVSKDIEELLSMLQNKNEEEVNTVNNTLKSIDKKRGSEYEIGELKKYNFKDVGSEDVVIVGKEYDIKSGKWVYEIETVDGIIEFSSVNEEELKKIELNNDNIKKIIHYYLGQKLDNDEKEIIEMFENGYITTRYFHKKKYDDYYIPK